jgi:hypothetical protein
VTILIRIDRIGDPDIYQRQLMTQSNNNRKVRKSQRVQALREKTRGRKLYLLDANGNKIRPEKQNKKTGQKQKKLKKVNTKNFVCLKIL